MFNLVPFRNRGLARRVDQWDIDSIFENFFNDSLLPASVFGNAQMKVDIQETPKEFIFEAEIPGANKDEINLEIDDNHLTISVNRQEEANETRDNYIRRERRSSAMARSFAVDNIIPEKATAKYENGILTINLPKKEETSPRYRKIDIQ
ncbi:MAG: Hsp20/alpha crystallin family protein [Peptococcaceae bacterium]|nr:Hsp20/alpha crystallin family protein [Peptococcaceae bacterium]